MIYELNNLKDDKSRFTRITIVLGSMLVFISLIVLPCTVMANEPDDNFEISGFDSDDEDFDETASIHNVEMEKGFLNDFLFTVFYDFSYGTKSENQKTITNRASISCEVDKTLSDIFLIRFDGKSSLYFHNDHVAKTNETVDDFNLQEFYIQASFEFFTLKAGKQIIVWGETDGDVMNDVVSPRDESEFIFTELKDARIGQYLISADFYSDMGDFLAFVTFKPGGNKTPEAGTQYYTGPEGFEISEDQTHFSDKDAGTKWNRSYKSFDLSLMAASLLQNKGVLTQKSAGVLEKRYGRYSFYGIGLGYTKGSFLFKFDASFKDNYSMQTLDSNFTFNRKKTAIADTALAIEYDANGRYLVNIEITNRHIIDYSSDMFGSEKNNTGIYLLFSKKNYNEDIVCHYILFYQFQEGVYSHETELEYSFSDTIELSLKYNYFQVDDKKSLFRDFRNEDRIGFGVKYYF